MIVLFGNYLVNFLHFVLVFYVDNQAALLKHFFVKVRNALYKFFYRKMNSQKKCPFFVFLRSIFKKNLKNRHILDLFMMFSCLVVFILYFGHQATPATYTSALWILCRWIIKMLVDLCYLSYLFAQLNFMC